MVLLVAAAFVLTLALVIAYAPVGEVSEEVDS